MIALLFLWIGAVSAGSLPRIIGGNDVHISKHPHQVSVGVYFEGVGVWHMCGGTIVHPNWVLTAAHCVEGEEYYIQTNDGTLHQNAWNYYASTIIMHPDYNNGPGAYPNDIALVKVYGDLTERDWHSTIPWATSGDFVGQNCTITGWGSTVIGEGGQSQQLQEATGKVLTTSQCAAKWPGHIDDHVHICYEDDDSSTCGGDSGGPMVCDGILVGVTSWGLGSCEAHYPSVMARVTSYSKWIVDTIIAY